MIARQRVVEAAALRQLAAAQFLPSLNLGTNYDSHTGNLQQSNGNILSVNRSAVYVGAGAARSPRARSIFPGSCSKETSPSRFTATGLAPGGRPAGVCHAGDPRIRRFCKRRSPTPNCCAARAVAPWPCKFATKQGESPS